MSQPVSGYYKHPEGQDLVGKLWYCNRISGILGMAVGFMDVQVYNKPKGYLGALGRMAYWTGPALGISTAFVATTYIATNLRKEDDCYNYMLGGAAAGSVVGAFRKSLTVGFVAAAAFALAGYIKKEAVDNDFTLMPDYHFQHQTISSRHFDFTLTPHIPGNWTRESK